MKQTLHKYFIPHEHNNYHPHILHTKRAVLYSGVAIVSKLMIFLLAFSIPAPVFVSPDVLALEEQEIIAEVNALRAAQAIPGMTQSTKLSYAARLKSQDMADHELFSHVASNGQGLAYFLNQADYNYAIAGENLAMGYSTVSDLMAAWKNSPTHYANIIDGDYHQTGVGIVGGVYEGVPTIYVAQHFGTPKVVAAAVVEEPVVESLVVESKAEVISTPEEVPVAEEEVLSQKVEEPAFVEDISREVPISTSEEVVVATIVPENDVVEEVEDEFPLYNQAQSYLAWEASNKGTVLRANVFLSKEVGRVVVQAQEYSFELTQQSPGVYEGTYFADKPPKKFFEVIYPASVIITTLDGEEFVETLSWESIFVAQPNAVDKYTMTKERLAPFMGIFEFTNYLYLGLFVFFALALIINIVVEWRQQHHHIIAQTVGLLALFAFFYIV